MPSEGVDGGTPFGVGDDVLQFANDWKTESGTFSLSTEGQPIFLYCLDNFEQPKPILAFMYGDARFTPAQDSYQLGESTRPQSLGLLGVIKVAPGFANAVFDAETDGYADNTLKSIIRNPANWKASDTDRFGPPGGAYLLATCSILGIVALVTTWLL
jgi:hypothetical protein